MNVFQHFGTTVQCCEESSVFWGVSVEQRAGLCALLNMSEGQPPVWYLGIPLQSQGLRSAEFQGLIQKLTDRIRGWAAWKLSYGGRVCLIKAVLESIAHFWCRIFFIPLGVLSEIQSLCRAYLWSREVTCHSYPVAWTLVCQDKERGDWDLRNFCPGIKL